MAKYHTKMAHKPGINQTELINAMDLEWVSLEIIESAIRKLVNSNEIRLDQNLIAKIDFKIKMSKDSDEVRQTALSRLEKSGFAPPTPSELAQEIEVSQDEIKTLMAMLTKENLIILIQRDFYLHQITWHRLLDFLKNYFSKYPEMQVSALKDFMQTTRKYAIPLFEYLDSEGYTERSGDVRRKGYKL